MFATSRSGPSLFHIQVDLWPLSLLTLDFKPLLPRWQPDSKLLCTLEPAGLRPIFLYSLHFVVTTSRCCESPLPPFHVHLALTTLKHYSGNRSRAETAGCNGMTGTLHRQVVSASHLQNLSSSASSTRWSTVSWCTSSDFLNSLVPGAAFSKVSWLFWPHKSSCSQGWLLALSKDPYSLIIYISEWRALTISHLWSLPGEFLPHLNLRCIFMFRQHKQAKMHSEIKMKVLQFVFVRIRSYTFVLV